MRISIHAPREGSDWYVLPFGYGPSWISIHAPREGSDASLASRFCTFWLFLSTLPARGATGVFLFASEEFGISIHAPREGSDL